jgi:hypothetical protein
VAAVTRADLLADGRPLPPRRTDAAEDEGHLWTPAWTVRDDVALLDPVALTWLRHTPKPSTLTTLADDSFRQEQQPADSPSMPPPTLAN